MIFIIDMKNVCFELQMSNWAMCSRRLKCGHPHGPALPCLWMYHCEVFIAKGPNGNIKQNTVKDSEKLELYNWSKITFQYPHGLLCCFLKLYWIVFIYLQLCGTYYARCFLERLTHLILMTVLGRETVTIFILLWQMRKLRSRALIDRSKVTQPGYVYDGDGPPDHAVFSEWVTFC